MVYTSEQIKDAQLENRARLEKINEIKTDILRGKYSMLKACQLASAFNMFPATYGKLVENLTRDTFGLASAPNETYGDASLYGVFGIEIKTSFTRLDGTLGLRQIRFHENIDYFLLVNYDDHNKPVSASADLFTAMDTTTDNMGKMQYYLLPRAEMQFLVKEYGGYTHGTNNNLGRITTEYVQSEGREFSLSYNAHAAPSSVPYAVWEYLQEFSYSQKALNAQLREIYNETDGLLEI